VLQDREKWNKKYRDKKYPSAPSRIVTDYFNLATVKKALDIAAGNGRNSLFLARQGFSVDAVDISEEGLRLLAGMHPNLHPICADLDTFDIAGNRYDLIVNVKFLSRRLFPFIEAGLAIGGILIFQAFLETGDPEGKTSMRREYLLGKNELLHAFSSLEIHYYNEESSSGDNENFGLASLVAVKKAVA
jgi:SAM-dependent methyltransferase